MTDKLREAAQQALEALDNMTDSQSNPARRNFPTIHDYGKSRRAADTLRAALAQQDAQAMPQGWVWDCCVHSKGGWKVIAHFDVPIKVGTRLNAAPTPPAQQDAQEVPPANCRQRLKLEGKAYPRSGCAVCGPLSLYQKKCDAMLNAAPTPPAQRVMLTDDEIEDLARGKSGHSDFARDIIEAYERKNGLRI